MLSLFAKVYMCMYVCVHYIYSSYIYALYIACIYSFSIYRFCKSFPISCIPLEQSLHKLHCVRKPANLDVLHPHLFVLQETSSCFKSILVISVSNYPRSREP